MFALIISIVVLITDFKIKKLRVLNYVLVPLLALYYLGMYYLGFNYGFIIFSIFLCINTLYTMKINEWDNRWIGVRTPLMIIMGLSLFISLLMPIDMSNRFNCLTCGVESEN